MRHSQSHAKKNKKNYPRPIRKFTGEANISGLEPPKFIKFSGETGEFSVQTDEVDNEGKSVYSAPIKDINFVIIKIRKRLETSYNDKIKGKTVFRTREFDYLEEPNIEVFQQGEKNAVFVGTYENIKKSYELQWQEVLYVSYSGQIYRLTIKGASLSPMWNYLSSFKNDSVIRYITNITSEYTEKELPNGGKLEYYTMKFERKGEYEKWQEAWEQLKAMNAHISNVVRKRLEELPPAPTGNEYPEAGGHSEDMGNVDDIPF